ncbi:ankyrin [Thozetella sp. PMI_491]|nr:ankyrin [Thozetella sp. PMI_491]
MAVDGEGRTLLHWLCHAYYDYADEEVNGDAISELLQHIYAKGGDVNAQDANGFTPLHLAAQSDEPALVETLLRLGQCRLPRKTERRQLWWRMPVGNTASISQLEPENHFSWPPPVPEGHRTVASADDYINALSFQHAIADDNVELCKDLYRKGIPLDLGAKIDYDGCPSGSALMAACFCGRIKAVQFLVRRGASLEYNGGSGYASAVALAVEHTDIIRWLLVTRFMEQPKIMTGRFEEEAEEKYWSGVVKAEWVIAGEDARQPHESSLGYWTRLMRIKRDLRGCVVPELQGRTPRRSRLVPVESVRVHPGDVRRPRY